MEQRRVELADLAYETEHLRFDRLPDGHYAVVDCDSINGTTP